MNGGTTYNGTTVFLSSDLDFTDNVFTPIGTGSNYFLGTFDGQGHVISNFKMSTSSYQYAGLFGYSDGLTLKNTVLGPSCSVASSINSQRAYVSGFIGYCVASKNHCRVESCVNMASITFSGNANTYSMHLGGICAGIWGTQNYDMLVSNCANYGHLIDTGKYTTNHVGGFWV